MGLLHYFLGLKIWQRDGELFVSQGKYAREILGKFHMEGCKPMDTPLLGNWRKENATSGEVVDSTLSTTSGFANVSSEHETRHFLCG